MKNSYVIGFIILVITSCNTGANRRDKQQQTTDTAALKTLESYQWELESCRYSGSFLRKLVNRTQLNNTYMLTSGMSNHYTLVAKHIFRTDTYCIGQSEVDSLEADYRRTKQEIDTLTLLPGSYWQQMKKAVLSRLEAEHRYLHLLLVGYNYPDSLLQVKASTNALKYAQLLNEGGEPMLQAWKQLSYRTDNSGQTNPIAIKEYEKKSGTDYKYNYARTDLMLFGWWNSVVELIPRVDYSQFQTHFATYFSHITQECDDLD